MNLINAFRAKYKNTIYLGELNKFGYKIPKKIDETKIAEVIKKHKRKASYN